jgi:hypothetical protein
VGLFELLSKVEGVRVRRTIFVIALLLVSPAVFTGFAADDYILVYELSRPPNSEWAGTPPLDLYRLFDPEHVGRLLDGAGLPWWTYDQATCAFMRPLSGLTHVLDHYLMPNNPIWAHLHSLLWFSLLLGVVTATYWQLLDRPWVAALASAMFALDNAHGSTVGWVVNRSAVVAAVFAVTALLCHHRQRSGAGMAWGFAGWAAFALGMFSAELALCIVGYLLAYTVFLDRGSAARRARALLPYALIGVVWAGLRSAGHYGTNGLYAYVDPVHEPVAFLQYLPARLALLIASQVSRLCSDLYEMIPATVQPWFLLAAVFSCSVTLWFTWPTLRTHRTARFWGVGTLLSAVPMAATQPSDRLLTLIGVGTMPLLAQAIYDGLQGARAGGHTAHPGSTALRGGLAAGYSAMHLVIAPVLLPVASLAAAMLDGVIQRAEASLPVEPGVREQTIIVAAAPDSAFMSYLPVIRSVNGKPRPRRQYWLVSTQAEVRIERRAHNVLRVTPARGFYDRRSEARSPLHPFAKGARIELSDMTVEIVELTADGRPAVCDFVFRKPLEASEYVWRTWRSGRLEPLPALPIGQSMVLQAS